MHCLKKNQKTFCTTTTTVDVTAAIAGASTTTATTTTCTSNNDDDDNNKPEDHWSCIGPVGRNTFLSSPHLCFIIVFICDLFVSRDDPLMS